MTDTQSLLDQLAQEDVKPAGSFNTQFVAVLLAVIALCALGVSLAFDGAFSFVERDGIGPMTVKWGFSIALLLLCAGALWVLGRPGRPSRLAMAALAFPFVPVALFQGLELSMVTPTVFGETWRQCLAAMLTMSPIAFFGAICATRLLAPVNLRQAGMAAGLFGGAVAMTAYAPFCPERSMAYMTVFYVLPILAMGTVGWLAGPKLLRW